MPANRWWQRCRRWLKPSALPRNVHRARSEGDLVQQRPHDLMSEGELARCEFVTAKLPLENRGIEIAQALPHQSCNDSG